MASPFSVFRKRQKLAMAVLCLLAMISFVILPYLQDLIGGRSRGPKNEVVVKTKEFGDLRESDMSRLRKNRQKVRAVLTELGQKTGAPLAEVQRQVDSVIGLATDDAVIDTWLKAQRAQAMGMVVSDDTVNRFLEEWTGNRVKVSDVQAAFKHNPAVTEFQFFDLMREELLARQFVEVFLPSLNAATPSQRWDYFNRVNCMATIEAIPVPVANYMNKIDDPTDEDLKKFFGENKETFPNPESPKPGFRSPQQVALEYFKADVAKFSTPQMVTDAEIQERYKKRKETYDQLFKTPSTQPPSKPGPTKESKGKQEPKGTKDAAKAKTPLEPKEEPKTPKTEPKTEKKEPTAQKPELDAPKQTPKAEPKESNKTKDSKGTSSAVGAPPFMLAALLQTEKSGDKAPADSPAASKPPVKAEPPAKAQSPGKNESPVAKEQKPAEKPAASEKKKTAETSDEFSKELKARIRQELAVEKIVKTFDRLRKPMDEYQQARRKYDLLKIRLEHEKKEVPPPPPEPDFEKLAKENGLTASRTKLMTQWEARDSEIGASVVGGRVPVWIYAYQALPNLRPVVSEVGDKTGYLFWKVEDVKEYVPKFEDKAVREEVLRWWKMIRARSLATKAAESLAAEARKDSKSLKQVFADRPDLQVVLPPKFSWMTFGNAALTSSQPAEISPVAGVPMAQDEFMRTVFQLEPGQVNVAFNAPQTIAYVVRPSEFTPSYAVRWKMFLVDSFSKYASAGYDDQRKIANAWIEEIKKSAGFEWGPGHKSDQPMEREQSAED